MLTKIQPLSVLYPSGSPQAVIWDMDGVLSHTMHLHWEAMLCACNACRIDFPEEIRRIGTGRNDAENLAYVVQKNGISSESGGYSDLLLALKSKKRNYLHELFDKYGVQTTPGTSAWLEALNDRSIPCAIASSTEMATVVRILEKLGFSGYFSALISGEKLPHSKPHPGIFLQAAAALGIDSSGCLVIEDSPHGIDAAIRAGMRCIAIATTTPLASLDKADIVVDSLLEYPVEIAFT